MTPRQVVLAEDEALIRLDLKEMLEEEGFSVVGEASDGEAAVRLARERTPDLVIMDVKMPGMDGLTAAKEIRQRDPAQAIIIYTAYLDPQLEKEAREAGVAMTVGKVEGLNQLERHITELCRDLTR